MAREQPCRATSAITETLCGKRASRILLAEFVLIVASIGLPAQTISVSSSSLTFAKQAVGTASESSSVTISNTASFSQAVSVTSTADFRETDTCSGNIAAHGSCNVDVSFAPTVVAGISGGVWIRDTSGNQLARVDLTGTGSAPVNAPSWVSFGSVPIGTLSAAKLVKVTNDNSIPVRITGITWSGGYVVNTGTCLKAALSSNASCSLTVKARPTAGVDKGSIIIRANGTRVVVALAATGTGNLHTPLVLSKTSLMFKAPMGGTSTVQQITVTNTSSSAVMMGAITASSDYAIFGTTCPDAGDSLAAAASCMVEIVFTPQVSGKITGSVGIAFTGTSSPQYVNMTGTALPSASATLTPSSAHQSSTETVVISGTSTTFGPTTLVNFGADITVGTVTVNGPTSASVPISIDNVAATGARNVTITTGAQIVTATFTVVAGVPSVRVISPNTVQPTQSENVTVTGAFTTWVNGTTKANFGPGISVGGAAAGTFGPVTVSSATSLTASLVTSGATAGLRTVQIQTGAQTLTVNNGIDVETCGTTPTVVSISPANNEGNVPLNSVVQVQFSQPMSRSAFSLGNSGNTTIYFYDNSVNKGEIPATISLDASGTIATITPTASLPAGHQFVSYLSYATAVQDACGTNLAPQAYSFYTGFVNNQTGPTLTGTSPVSGDTNIPRSNASGTSTPVVLQFNNPLDPITVQTGLSMTTGSNPVAGVFSYSANDQIVTFTPSSPLAASTTYTVNYNAQITDNIGNPLTNPGSFSFTTGTSSDTTSPAVTVADPPTGTFNVGLNVTPHITFSEPVNGLTIPSAFNLYYENNAPRIPATVTVAANRLSATITPTAPLQPNTYYGWYLCGYTNIAGNNGNCFGAAFSTGGGADTAHATVTTISPANAQTGIPLNTRIVAVLSDDIDPTTVSNSSITVTPQGGSPIAGTVTLSNSTTLTFAPSSALAASTVYNVAVGGFNDVESNAVTAFASSFTTGTTSFGGGSFTLNGTNPLSGATNVSVTSPVTFTMSNLVNPASVNNGTVYVYVNATGNVMAGSYTVSGNAVTFTPLTQYPANTVIAMQVCNLTDEAGNSTCSGVGTFTTATAADHTAPTVTISPPNGTANVGLNTQIVVTFSKSINPATITSNSLALFNGDSPVGLSYTISRDNRTITINPSGNAWTTGATITLELTSAVQDLSGNALANTTSQFTLTTALPSGAPSVIAMRPGNGATGVAANTPITLFINAAMNASTIAGALSITDNGVVVTGTLQTFSNAQGIAFTPDNAFNAGHLIQVFLGSSAQSADGVALSSFSGQFTVAGSAANTTGQVQLVNPPPSASNVPLNTIIQIEYNQALLPISVNNFNVSLYQYATSSYLTPTISLVGGGQVIQIQPTSNLVANSQYQVCVGGNVTNIDGIRVQSYCFSFYAGAATDTAAPTIIAEAPSNGATNIGTNALATVTFNKAINPISVTGSTIQLRAGATIETLSSVAFSPDYKRVSVTPQAPLPLSTAMTLAVSGVLSQAGVSVASTTTNFATAAQPDFSAPYVVTSSVQSGQSGVPINSAFSLTFSKPIDPGSFGGNTVVGLYNYTSGQYVASTISWSANQTTIFIVPNTALAVGTQYELFSYYMTDLDGNAEQNFAINFTTSFSTNTNAPTVVNTSPENGVTQVPNNAPVEILFSEPIQPTSIGQITLTTGATAVAFTSSFSDANQLLTLIPNQPLLAANATYTITITGVKDAAGNLMVGTVTNTFTTGSTFDLVAPQVVLVDPVANSVSVGINIATRVQFSKRLNPLSVVTSSNESYASNASVELYNNISGQWVPNTVNMSADRMTATLTPAAALKPNNQYIIYVGCSGKLFYDTAGNAGGCSSYYFTTGTGADTTHSTVTTIAPASGQTGVPLNTRIVAVLSDDIDPTTVSNSSITVTPQGGSPIAGTLTLSNATTLAFSPSAALIASTVYNVSVSGFKDTEGNTITAFASSFTTGTTSFGSGSFTLNGTSPASGATNVSVTSPVTFTMSNLINPASVNNSTVYVYVNATGYVMAGTYAVSGNAVTFTPLTQYPANTVMAMQVCNLTDEAGNSTCSGVNTFTTANTPDTTKPIVTITPANAPTNLGLNTQVVLTFSKSINPATIGSTSVNLFNGDVPLNPSVSISRDNRTVVLSVGVLPAAATITVAASHLITDLSGNALADTSGHFTTAAPTSNSAPVVISMVPGNGATNVPTSAVITLYTNVPMNATTFTGAMSVSQNGVLISGTATAGSNSQSVEFTPTSALAPGTVTQVFLNSTAQDIYGNYLQYFAGSFTTAGSPTNTAAQVQSLNPPPGATSVPLNTTIQVEYNQALLAASVNNYNVSLYQYATSSYLTPTVSLVGGGQVIQIQPTSNLVPNSQYQVCIGSVTNVDGIRVQSYCLNFTAGATVDIAAPTILAVAPANAFANIGTNSRVSVTFNKAVNPVSVTGSTIQLSAGTTIETLASISFSADYKRVTITSQAPLPASTVMTIAINGVTSQAGVAVATQSTSFTTMAGPDFSAPYVVSPSVQSNQTVGTNTVFAMQFNKAMDPGSVNVAGNQWVFIYDFTTGTYVTTSITLSVDLTTVMLQPITTLNPSHSFEMCSNNMTDLSGVGQNNFCVSFFSAAGTITTGPSVVQVSPASGMTGVPINAPVQILFNEQIDGASIGGVTLKQGASVVPTTALLYDGNKGIQLQPTVPLAVSTVYTINVTGVLDITGNAQTAFSSQSYTTGTSINLVRPTLVSTNPTNGQTGVPVNTTVKVVFSEPMDVASFDASNSFYLYDNATATIVPATINFSANSTTATLTLVSNLTGGGVSYTMYIGWNAPLYDVGGNQLSGTTISFTTQ
jgi:hypothetical protein